MIDEYILNLIFVVLKGVVAPTKISLFPSLDIIIIKQNIDEQLQWKVFLVFNAFKFYRRTAFYLVSSCIWAPLWRTKIWKCQRLSFGDKNQK